MWREESLVEKHRGKVGKAIAVDESYESFEIQFPDGDTAWIKTDDFTILKLSTVKFLLQETPRLD